MTQDQQPADRAVASIDGPSVRVSGSLRLQRVGWWRFPTHELVADGHVVARLGRSGWFRIYFGRGQRIELAGGERWLLRSVGLAGAICPVVVDADGRKIAIAGIGHGTYGLNTRDDAYVFFPARRRGGGRRTFILRRYEEEIAVVDRYGAKLDAAVPVPLGVVLLCVTLVRLGIPGESVPTVPSFRWG
jgi:hypothetical protein